MNEDFLMRFRKEPRPEFAAELYRRIEQPARPGVTPAVRAALAASALFAALALTLLASPAARAAVLSWVRDIGGVSFLETSDYPGVDHPDIVPEKTLSLEEAARELPFSIQVPGWVPDGYIRDATVRITRFSDAYTPVTITWRNASTNGMLELTIGQTIGDWIVGEESVEAVKIGGREAALVQGMWNADQKAWDSDGVTGLTLVWTDGDLTYSLYSPTLSRDELIRAAASIP